MPLRLFGAGSTRVRACPACERETKADATFCPSCYMLFRPEGAAALREYLQGARVPPDVYLLRKMQTEDPNAGPVTRVASGAVHPVEAPSAPPPKSPVVTPPPEAPSPAAEAMPPPPQIPSLPEPFVLEAKPAPRKGQNGRTRSRPKSGMEGLLTFIDPLPPPMRFPDDLPALYAWMLEKDPVIPNNTVRLEEIHAEVFRDKPAARLGYEQHILLQVADDLFLHATEEALVFHLAQLAAAYRRAADTYHKPESNSPVVVNQALWEVASLASRMRMEAWVYHTRYGETPRLPSTRQRELPLRFPGT